MKKIAMIILILFSFTGEICSSKIVLSNGRYIYGEIIAQNDRIIEVKSKFGIIHIPREKVLSITDEQEPPRPQQRSNYKWPFQDIDRETLRLSLKYGNWKWHNTELKAFNEKSFDYLNRMGEVRGFLGDSVEKDRQPKKINWASDMEFKISKRIGIFQLGLMMGTFSNSSTSQIRINNERYFDEWKLTGTCLGVSGGLAQISKQQMYSGLEVKGNFINFAHRSENSQINSQAFFVTFKLISGYIFDLSRFFALKVEFGYIIATKPVFNHLYSMEIHDEFYNVPRTVFSTDTGNPVKFKLSGYELSIGMDIKILTKPKLK